MGDLADKEEVSALRGCGHCLQWLCALIRAGLNLDRQVRPDTHVLAFFFSCVAEGLIQCKGTEKASDRDIRRGWRVPTP